MSEAHAPSRLGWPRARPRILSFRHGRSRAGPSPVGPGSAGVARPAAHGTRIGCILVDPWLDRPGQPVLIGRPSRPGGVPGQRAIGLGGCHGPRPRRPRWSALPALVPGRILMVSRPALTLAGPSEATAEQCQFSGVATSVVDTPGALLARRPSGRRSAASSSTTRPRTTVWVISTRTAPPISTAGSQPEQAAPFDSTDSGRSNIDSVRWRDRSGSSTSHHGVQDGGFARCVPPNRGRRVDRERPGHRPAFPASRLTSPYRCRRLPVFSPSRPTINLTSKPRDRLDRSQSESERASGPPAYSKRIAKDRRILV
jgi:hypothetical protein